MAEPLLVLEKVSKTFYGIQAVKEVTLSVGRGRVLGLIGQNGAGKSTLMNMIGGVVEPDADSRMTFDDKPYSPRKPADATAAGVAFIHQELNLFTNLTIAENIFIDKFPRVGIGPFQLIDRHAVKLRAAALLEAVDLKVAPDTLIDDLAPGERQLVEIAKALHSDAKLIIFDEPTTSLTARETEKLFALIERLRTSGKTIIYISHILGDVMRLADDVAVLRDGQLVEAGEKSGFNVARMITAMIGRDLDQLYSTREGEAGSEISLDVRGVSQKGIVKEVTFQLRKGEVLGLFGLMGSGRTELARILFGLDEVEAGNIQVNGVAIKRRTARGSISGGMAFVTENRREEGLMMEAAIARNIELASLPDYARPPVGVLDGERLLEAARSMAGALTIKSGAIERSAAKSLSGGNQQKVVISKWLMSNPQIFIVDEPTRGIDVGAKYEIYTIIHRLADSGNSILFISSEVDELMGMCDRILVMSRGEIVGEFPRRPFDKERILRAAFRENAMGEENER